ncbi:MAG TPA: response regulator, partial [Geobacterales bacterium]|nr:response regulator [Geobacterales bacterium]
MDERILLVDDDRFFREMYADLLRRERYDVDVADSAGEALNLLEKQRYALVISDMIMPDMNGLDLLLRIKRHTPSTDVIIVTGHANVESAIHALKNGARDYLVKPCNHDEFRHTVALALQQHHLLDENH